MFRLSSICVDCVHQLSTPRKYLEFIVKFLKVYFKGVNVILSDGWKDGNVRLTRVLFKSCSAQV